MLLSSVITLFLPRRYFWYGLGWLGIPALFLFLDICTIYWRSKNVGYAFGLFFIEGAAVVWLLVILIKIGCWDRSEAQGKPQPISRRLKYVLGFAWGMVIAALVFLLLRQSFQGAHPAYLSYLYAWIVYGVFLGVVLLINSCHPLLLLWRKGIIVGACVTLPLLVALSMFYGYYVRGQAERIAGGMPYCIQTNAKDMEYTTATTLLDLSALTMSAHTFGEWASEFHAFLMVEGKEGRRFYNWSYKRSRFEPTGFAQFVNCKGKKRFVRSLPFIFADEKKIADSESRYFSYLEKDFLVPARYAPELHSSNGSVVLHIDTLKDEVMPCCIPSEQVTFGLLSRGERASAVLRQDEKIIDKSKEHGLAKIVWSDGHATGVRYTQGERKGHADTLISCMGDYCQHQFSHRGIVIHFNYSLKQVAQWQEKQAIIIALLESILR